MMDYLRGLSPAHADARHRAVVAPRSRYEIDQPIRAVPRADAPEVERDEPVVARAPRQLNPIDRRLEIEDLSAALVRPLQEPLLAARRSRTDAIVASHHELESPIGVMPVESGMLPGATVAALPPLTPAVGLPSSQAVSEPVRAAVPTHRERVTLASRPEQRSVDHGPLSQQALASRVVPQSDRPPIVHVTIDRVDVRAPAAPDRPAPRPRPRATTSGSLTDYLQTRQRRRGGGPS